MISVLLINYLLFNEQGLEAWRQYFGRFKKQLAEIALNGGAPTRYGSRPGSGASK